jgi:DNA-binding NarL/FixJ family response regulator/anti-sigma regulatory factor (Ser/Thr protein kinase)
MSSLQKASLFPPKEHCVLMVVSDLDTTNMLLQILSHQECDFRCAPDNEEAFAMAEKDRFDLIVTGARTSGSEDIELLRKLRNVRPHTRLIILTDENTPADVITAITERAFSYFSKPFSRDALAEMIRTALRAPCWDDGIEVLSATPAWIRLLARGDKNTADRLLQFVNEVVDLPPDEKGDVAFAIRELLLNAVRHGTRLDPNKFVEVSYVRAERMVSCRITDPGEGFSFQKLEHAAVSNTPSNPIRHAVYREAAGLPPGGYGILLAQHMVDELIYDEDGNDVLLIKYIDGRRSLPSNENVKSSSC